MTTEQNAGSWEWEEFQASVQTDFNGRASDEDKAALRAFVCGEGPFPESLGEFFREQADKLLVEKDSGETNG